jgi:magnesium transporter
MGPIAWLWFGDVQIGAVIAVAMIINLIAAGFSGIVTPIVLERLGIDPAVASTVVLTAITDVVGFLAFLGLAALVLL